LSYFVLGCPEFFGIALIPFCKSPPFPLELSLTQINTCNMKEILKRAWRNVLLTGIFSILFGALTLFWPGVTLTTLVWIFALAVIAQGISVIHGSWVARGLDSNWWVILLLGIVYVIAGIFCFANPGLTAVYLVILMGVSWLITGVLEIYAAISLRKQIANEGWLALSGVLSVLAGLYVILRPGAGALALVWLIGGFSITFGIVLIMLALKAKNWASDVKERVGGG